MNEALKLRFAMEMVDDFHHWFYFKMCGGIATRDEALEFAKQKAIQRLKDKFFNLDSMEYIEMMNTLNKIVKDCITLKVFPV